MYLRLKSSVGQYHWNYIPYNNYKITKLKSSAGLSQGLALRAQFSLRTRPCDSSTSPWSFKKGHLEVLHKIPGHWIGIDSWNTCTFIFQQTWRLHAENRYTTEQFFRKYHSVVFFESSYSYQQRDSLKVFHIKFFNKLWSDPWKIH